MHGATIKIHEVYCNTKFLVAKVLNIPQFLHSFKHLLCFLKHRRIFYKFVVLL
jgi:hypothetical protein